MKAAIIVGCAAVAAALAGCQSDKGAPLTAVATSADSADQVMFGVRFNLVDNGLLRGKVVADTAYMYEENTRTEMRKVESTFYTATGAKNGMLTSRQGTYNSRVGSMEARGDVVVVGDDGRKLQTPQLKYDPTRNEISSDSNFVFDHGERHVEGRGFVSDPNMLNIRILSGMKAKGGTISLPKR